MIDTIVDIVAVIGFLTLIIFASIGALFTWKAFSFASQLAYVEWRTKKIKSATDEAKSEINSQFLNELEKEQSKEVTKTKGV